MVLFGEHRLALMEARVTSAKMLEIHREVLNRQRQMGRYQLGIARRALDQERARTTRAVQECGRVYEEAKAEAQEYRVVWARAKKEGAILLKFVDRRLKRAA